MRFGLVSFAIDFSGTDSLHLPSARRTQFDDIFDHVARQHIGLLLFAGWSIPYKQDEAQDAQALFKEVTSQTIDVGCTSVLELMCSTEHSGGGKGKSKRSSVVLEPSLDGYYILRGKESGPVALGPIEQRFATSNEAYDYVGELLKDLEPGGKRYFNCGVDAILIICGENNFLRNIRDEELRATVRVFRGMPKDTTGDDLLNRLLVQPFDVVLNPAHTRMGQINLMRRRWEVLSSHRPGRTVLFATSSTTHLDLASLQYVFRDGECRNEELKIIYGDGWKLGIFEDEAERKRLCRM